MSPELDTYVLTKKVKEVLTDNNLGETQTSTIPSVSICFLLPLLSLFPSLFSLLTYFQFFFKYIFLFVVHL